MTLGKAGQGMLRPHAQPPTMLGMSNSPFQPGAQLQPSYQQPQFCCPYCRSSAPPTLREEVSQNGWIVMIALLLLCFPLFWVGFLIREPRRYCSSCGVKWG